MRTSTWPVSICMPSRTGMSTTQPSARLEIVTMSALTRASYS